MQVHDWKLLLGVLSLVVVDVIILSVYTIVEHVREPGVSRLQAQRVINREYPEEESEVSVVVSTSTVHVYIRVSRGLVYQVDNTHTHRTESQSISYTSVTLKPEISCWGCFMDTKLCCK